MEELPNFSLQNEVFDSRSSSVANNENEKPANSTSTRFANLSEDDLQKLLTDKQSEQTKKSTNWCISTLKGW